MIEGRRVTAGEAILTGLATIEHRQNGSGDIDRSQAAISDAALESLVREHSRLVYRIAYAALRSHADAEDATQETFLRVLRHRTKLTSVEDPKTWLARIAWRVAVDRSRSRTRQQEIALEFPAGSVPEVASGEIGADDALHGSQISAMIEKMIAALAPKLREPLILSTVEEMSPREVAATLGINEAAVRSRIFRARQILKEKLSQRSLKR
ncbi:MAG TPA: RNA polymerase sigma factor [Verrucomicrobiae bacterium]|nr:RNA polymerase sigma factor [Verrucomicrobiae bacterium]